MVGLITDLKSSTGCGLHLALVHAGKRKGFVLNMKLVFPWEKNIANAHGEMDGNHYEKHFVMQLLDNLPLESVITVDNVFYQN
jgi:hypothetical protein